MPIDPPQAATRPRAIFFDMDDTLLDTSGGVMESWEIACRDAAPALGIEWEVLRTAILRDMANFWRDEAAVEHWRTRLADAREHVIGISLAAEGLDCAYARRISDVCGKAREERLVLFEDALETLDWLRRGGYHLGLITNGPAAMQRAKVDRFDLASLFDVVVIEGEFGFGKPSPRVFEHALQVTGTAPKDAWHVGDNLYADIGGAQAAGLQATWIHRGRLEMKDGQPVPDRVIEHLDELRQTLQPDLTPCGRG